MADIDAKFTKAAEDVKVLKNKPDDNTLLKLYALYKSATVGEVQGDRPSVFKLRDRYKWDAWKEESDKGLTKEQAKQEYIDLVTKLQSED